MKIGGWDLSFRPLDHLNLKIISFVLAVGLWSVVPTTTTPHSIRGVPVRLQGIPVDLALSEPFEATLDVEVVGPTARARDLIPGELSPSIDLFGAHAGENTITLQPEDIPAPFGVDVQSVQPSRITVRLEQRIRAERPVNAVVEGEPAAGYVMAETRTDPATVTVIGPRSHVEALEAVSTEVVSVAGQSESLTRRVSVLTNHPLVEVTDAESVQLTIRIAEEPTTLQLEELTVRVIGGSTRVAVNPDRVGIVLRGPPSVLEGIGPDNLVVTVDVTDLPPRAEDYSIAPTIRFSPEGLRDSVQIIALTPQRELDVHVFDRP